MAFEEHEETLSSSTASEEALARFTPKFYFDLSTANPKKFKELMDEYSEWHKQEPVEGPVPLNNGWHTITPEIAEQLLRRNFKGANRKASLTTILYYANQMVRRDWPKTGQPLLFSVNGTLLDGQHRLWACLLSGATFSTYVVMDVPIYPQLFAYIDNCRPRAPAVALQTAGFNGVSPIIAAVVRIASEIGDYTVNSTGKHDRLAPIDVVRLAETMPHAQLAARLASSDWEPAVNAIGHKDVIAYLGMRIIDLHDQSVADEFLAEIGDVDAVVPPDSVIAKLRKMVADDRAKQSPMKRHQMLGNLIKAFNAWIAGENLPKRWVLAVNDDYPTFNQPAREDEQA